MYIPEKMKVTNPEAMHRFIEQFTFASMITHTDKTYQASHLPFLIKPAEGTKGFLYAHMAKANPHWQSIENNHSLVIFNGPHAYISPRWSHTQPAVPTWNYTTVHITGSATLLNSAQTRSSLDELLDHLEPNLRASNCDAISDEHINKLLGAIVGFKVNIESIEAKFKLGQHKSRENQISVAEGLSQSSADDAKQLLKFMRAWDYFPN